MRISRIIFSLALALCILPEAGAQLKLVSKEKLKSVNSPQLSRDSASVSFVTRHIVAERMTEDDAPKTFTYEFTNVGRSKLEIKRLVSTCSCAQAICTKKIVEPGEKASVMVTYNPKGHPGRFERKVFVYTEGEDDPAAILRLSVNVSNGADMSREWPVQMGPVRLRRQEVTFAEGVKAAEKMRFVNLSGKPLTLSCEEAFLPECLSFRTDPVTVPAGEEGQIVISYDPSASGSRETMKVILKDLGLPPSKATISVRITR